MMVMFRQQDGFSRKEVQELQEAFELFDKEDFGEISCMQLLDLMRHLGFDVDLAQVQRHITEVDFNESHSLDFREFLRLMRLEREQYLRRIFTAFQRNGMAASAVEAVTD